MVSLHIKFYKVFIAVLLVSGYPFSSAMAATITIGGTGSGLGVMRLLGEAFNRSHLGDTIEVLPSLGSNGGIRALKDGVLAVAIVSRTVQDEEGEGISVYDLGWSPFVFAAHSEVAEDDVTLSQVADIYSGKIAVWRDGTPIRRILRPADESDWRLLQGISPVMADALHRAENTAGLFIAMTDTDVTEYLEKSRGSFGSVVLTQFLAGKHTFKILSLDGVQANIEALVAHRYPLAKPYFLVIKHDAAEPVKRFMRFVQSDEGRQILNRSGITANMPMTRE